MKAQYVHYSIANEHYSGKMSHAYCSCYVVTVHQRVGNGTFVVTPLVSPGNQVTVIVDSMPAQPLGSFLVL